MARAFAPEKCVALHFLHAFSRCDTVSSFADCEKRTVWDILKTFNDVSPAFCTLASTCSSVDDQLDVLDHSVVLLYDLASSEEEVNEARKQLFSQKGDQWMAFHRFNLHLWHTQRESPPLQIKFRHRCS